MTMVDLWEMNRDRRCPICHLTHIVRSESCNDNAIRRIVREELTYSKEEGGTSVAED